MKIIDFIKSFFKRKAKLSDIDNPASFELKVPKEATYKIVFRNQDGSKKIIGEIKDISIEDTDVVKYPTTTVLIKTSYIRFNDISDICFNGILSSKNQHSPFNIQIENSNGSFYLQNVWIDSVSYAYSFNGMYFSDGI